MSASAEGDPQGCTENQVKSMLARSPVGAKLSRWVSCGKGSVAAVRRAPLSTEHRACTHARSRMRILALPPALPLTHPTHSKMTHVTPALRSVDWWRRQLDPLSFARFRQHAAAAVTVCRAVAVLHVIAR